MKKTVILSILILILNQTILFSQEKAQLSKQANPQITFIELGSVNCIPCKKMQPVMKAIEQKYGDQVKVIFYDVWTKEQQPYALKYAVRLIPTQVFLDENGQEFFRHEGFFPENEIHKIFKQRGLSPGKIGG